MRKKVASPTTHKTGESIDFIVITPLLHLVDVHVTDGIAQRDQRV